MAQKSFNAEARRAYSILLLHEGKIDDALRLVHGLYRRQPDGRNALALGNISRARGSFREAVAYFKKAAGDKSVEEQAAIMLALTYRNIGDFHSAKRWARKTLLLIGGGKVKVPHDKVESMQEIIRMR